MVGGPMDYPEAERLRNRIKHLESRTNTLSDRYRVVSRELYEARDKLNKLTTRIEPHNGTLIRFNHKYSPGGQDYEFFALKLSNGRWITSSTFDRPHRSSISSGLARYTNWENILAFVGDRPIDVVTQYERFQADTDGIAEWNEYFRQFKEPAKWVNVPNYEAWKAGNPELQGCTGLTEPTEHPHEGNDYY